MNECEFNPAVYRKSIECCDLMEEIVPNSMVANAIRYLFRFDSDVPGKGGKQSVMKAIRSLMLWLRTHGNGEDFEYIIKAAHEDRARVVYEETING